MVEARDLPVWRSLMFVPVNVSKYVNKAASYGADGIVLDLEDSIAPAEKAPARALVPDAARIVASRGADVLVRVNRPLELAVRDIEAVISPAITALMIPKVESAGHIRLLAELVSSHERARGMPDGHTKFYAVVESVQAFPHMFEIAAADRRIVAFGCGTEDFTASTGSQPDPDVLLYPKQMGIIAARAAGVTPLGVLASGANYRDLDGFRKAVANSKRFGIEGSACIHPSQVTILNEGFSPSESEIAEARKVVEAYQQAIDGGRGAVGLDGRMLDVPVVERSQRILKMAQRIAKRHARTSHT